MQRIAQLLHHAATGGQFRGYFEWVKGYLHPLEGYALTLLAATGSGDGAVVEIGSFLGKGTCHLASGSKSAKRGPVTTVDHFMGSPEHQRDADKEEPTLLRDGTLFDRFKANIELAELTDWVTPIQEPSLDAAGKWQGPIRLLFIDADNSYEASRADFEAWSPFVTADGLVVLHNVEDEAGVTQFYNELMTEDSGWRTEIGCASLRVLSRKP